MSFELHPREIPGDRPPETQQTCAFVNLAEALATLHALDRVESHYSGSSDFNEANRQVYSAAEFIRRHNGISQIIRVDHNPGEVIGRALLLADGSEDCSVREHRCVRKVLIRNFPDFIEFLAS